MLNVSANTKTGVNYNFSGENIVIGYENQEMSKVKVEILSISGQTLLEKEYNVGFINDYISIIDMPLGMMYFKVSIDDKVTIKELLYHRVDNNHFI